jgi:transcription elongation factor GreA
MEKFKITKTGFAKMKELLDNLKNIERPKIINQIAAARELGDLKENADYHSSREKQGFIEAQIADFEDKIARAEIIDVEKLSGNKVVFGATVHLEDLNNDNKITYKIVSDFESDIENNLISNISPVARALLGKEVGDEVEIKVPSGEFSYEILKIEFI